MLAKPMRKHGARLLYARGTGDHEAGVIGCGRSKFISSPDATKRTTHLPLYKYGCGPSWRTVVPSKICGLQKRKHLPIGLYLTHADAQASVHRQPGTTISTDIKTNRTDKMNCEPSCPLNCISGEKRRVVLSLCDDDDDANDV